MRPSLRPIRKDFGRRRDGEPIEAGDSGA